MTDFLKLAKEAYESSTTYIDANYRADWDYSLKAFNNQHAPGSKYLSEEYKHRSRIFHPKTRSIIRKNEAAAAVALFSNMDIVDVTPGNPSNVMSVASAAALKQVLEYRLTKTIPAFPLVMGAVQDAQTTGTVCSYQYWEYLKKPDGRKVKDKPCIELRPIENIRLDSGANWLDPVNTSPYFCDIVPMYACDVRAMMKNRNDKTSEPKWKHYEDSEILKARPDMMDSTREARLNKYQDPHTDVKPMKEFDIVWVLRWCMRDSQGDDHCFYTLGKEQLLTDPKPIEEVYFHGKRPYVIGCAIIETHKALKTSMPILVKPLQQGINTVGNSRFDNVQLVLNKRYYVARGRQVDTQSLIRNVAGGVTLTNDPNTDIVEANWADVTSSSYVEHDRFNSEIDDLAGNFSPYTKVANNAVNDTLGGSRMANQSAGIMSDYLLRTIIETWWEPVLRQLVLLERYYETDEVILGICAEKAQLFPKYGISAITDMMMMNEVDVSVNVGMGASNPGERFQKFVVATKTANELIATSPPSANVQEMVKEIFSNAGYRDGSRFYSDQIDPRLAKAMQMIQQLQGAIQGKQGELQLQAHTEQQKLLSNERVKAAELRVDEGRISGDLQIRQAELAVEQQRLQLEAAKIELEKLRLQIEASKADQELQLTSSETGAQIELANIKLEQERKKLEALTIKIAGELEEARLSLATVQQQNQNESRIGEVASHVSSSLKSMTQDMEALRAGLAEAQKAMGEMDGLKMSVASLGQGFNAMAHAVQGNMNKKKPTGFRLKKPDGKKTRAIQVSFDDGTSEEMTVE